MKSCVHYHRHGIPCQAILHLIIVPAAFGPTITASHVFSKTGVYKVWFEFQTSQGHPYMLFFETKSGREVVVVLNNLLNIDGTGQ